MTSAASAAKSALVTDLATVFPSPVEVSYGHPGTYLADEIVSVGNIRFARIRGPLSTQRKMDEHLEIDVVISVWRGGATSQQAVTERALAMLASLETYLTDVGTVNSSQLTLHQSVRQAWVTAGDVLETDTSMTDADGTPLLNLGRIAEIPAVISADARI